MEQFSRTEKVIGKEKVNLLKGTSVLVVGVGGVGGMCVEMLARSGIGNISLIDYDTFECSNLNRQILSTIDNIGESKVAIAKKRINSINPNCNIKTYNYKIDVNFSGLEEKVDYIVDACDDIKAKIVLIKYALNNDIKIISCCGTGNRMEPQALKITNVWKTEYDPLAKKLRTELRKEKINYKLPVVCSSEKPLIKTQGEIGSVAMVPNAAGILLASYVINDVIER